MSLEEYDRHLLGLGIPEADVAQRLALIREFERFLGSEARQEVDAAGKGEAEKFARKLILENRNTLENFSALGDYAAWAGLRKLHVAWIELMDCHNALAVLAAEIERSHGQDIREKIFTDPLPPPGADEKERGAYTRMITERMAGSLTAGQARRAWFTVQHGIPAEDWRRIDAQDREKFLRSGDIDEFLSIKRRERDEMLTRLRDEDKLWYTVKISDEVLEFVKSDPEMEGGRREGDSIYITKIPYNAVRYLQETDPRLKRYYACHCPLVRQALLDGRPVSPDVCHCSLGHASHYLAGIGRTFRGEVLESAVRGDLRCRFVFRPVKKRD
ncbi:MAG: hypothetical protein WBM17_05320 [Anaerolineales bacterium]